MTREAQIRQTADEWLGYYHPTCTQDMLVEAFRCGAQWADAHQPPLWISVEERLPKEDKDNKGYSVEVIGLFLDGDVGKCYCGIEEGIWFFVDGWTCDRPTHWMPMPKLQTTK